MTERVKDIYKYWLNQNLEDTELTKELETISLDAKAIEERFYKDLEFGTGGLRGIMGAGTNRMNVYTVARATQGYCSYLKKIYSGEIHVSIAFDSRLNSVNFARTAGEVFAANGIIVHIYPELMPPLRCHLQYGSCIVMAVLLLRRAIILQNIMVIRCMETMDVR